MIDWEKHWEQHALNFEDGHLVLSVGDKIMRLKPGPGFGDLSHPTTRLVLKLMPPLVAERTVFDVGCGSGILALAAAAMGAKHVYAIDIDPDAKEHTQLNIDKNGLSHQISVVEKLPSVSDALVLMNMIWNEQKQAWVEGEEYLTSGILKEQREDYLDWIDQKGCQLIECVEEEIWCGFHFKSIR